jgi:hypothetical protein
MYEGCSWEGGLKEYFMATVFWSCLALAWLFTSCWLTAQAKDPSWLLGFIAYALGFFGAAVVMIGVEQDRANKAEED